MLERLELTGFMSLGDIVVNRDECNRVVLPDCEHRSLVWKLVYAVLKALREPFYKNELRLRLDSNLHTMLHPQHLGNLVSPGSKCIVNLKTEAGTINFDILPRLNAKVRNLSCFKKFSSGTPLYLPSQDLLSTWNALMFFRNRQVDISDAVLDTCLWHDLPALRERNPVLDVLEEFLQGHIEIKTSKAFLRQKSGAVPATLLTAEQKYVGTLARLVENGMIGVRKGWCCLLLEDYETLLGESARQAVDTAFEMLRQQGVVIAH